MKAVLGVNSHYILYHSRWVTSGDEIAHTPWNITIQKNQQLPAERSYSWGNQ